MKGKPSKFMGQFNRAKVCDHTSVGMLVWKSKKLLLIERRKFPFGFAPPAGHVDDDLNFEQAAKRELEEEVGLKTRSLELLFEANISNYCGREEGDWHHWKVYKVRAEGRVKRSDKEAIKAEWLTLSAIKQLTQRTQAYIDKKITEEEWKHNPGIELVWLEIFNALGLV